MELIIWLSLVLDLERRSLCYVVLGCVLFWLIWDLVRTWWRLRHIPSVSITAPFSYFWLARTTYSGRQYWVHRNLHDKLGPLVRIGPNEVLTNDPNILRTISSTRSQYSRSSWYSTGRFNPYHDNLFTILEPGPHNKAKARSIAAYNGRETPGLESAINEQVETLVKVVRTRYVTDSPSQSQPLLDLRVIMCYFTMDVITRLGFGSAVGYLQDETDHFDFFKIVSQLWPRMSTSADVPWIHNILFSPLILSLLGPKSSDKKGFGALMGIAERQVWRRFAEPGPQKKDLLGSLIDRGFTEEECQSEGLFLLLAGTESTANAIRSILVHIMSSAVVYSRLEAEIQEAVQKGGISYPISFEQAKKLSYLQAVIYEGIRMRPPLLGLFPKVVPPSESPVFHNMALPAGTAVCMNASSLLNSTALFGADAAVFRSERFIEAGDKRGAMERGVDMAFGYGGWACAGKSIAMMELVKVVFEMFRLFDMQLVNPFHPCDALSYGVFLEKGLMVKVAGKTNG